MKHRYLIILFTFLFIKSFSQEKYTISGYITDKNNGETIIGANIYTKSSGKGVSTNNYGFYSFSLEEGSHNIIFSFLGYESIYKNINLDKDIELNIEFETSSVKINEINISSESNIIEKTQTSVIEVPIEQIKNIPAIFGEVDVLKAIQLLPGVQSSEGTSGFYVRGGGPDQNLILLDGVPVYNSSHLGGLFSVFNADAIKSVRLTKGGFPARFGGRLSSVLEIDMKEGNNKNFKADATLGLISSKITLEGTIIKNKTSFIISGRRTYADLLIKPFINNDNNESSLGIDRFNLYFYDLNAKINHKLTKKDRIYLSAYMGDDIFNIKTSDNFDRMQFGLGYGNITSTFRWNHLFNSRLFSNTTLTYSRYSFNTGFSIRSSVNNDTVYNPENQSLYIGESSDEFSYQYISGIQDLGVRVDFDYIPNPNHSIKYGISYTHHEFFPGESNLYINTISPDTTESFLLDTNINFSERTKVHEAYIYFEDNIQFSSRLKANIGLHIGYYALDDSIYRKHIYDYLTYEKFYNIQPRFSARYLLNDDWSIKGSYAEMQQNIHLLSNSSVGLPSDLWVPAVPNVPSQKSRQLALGINTMMYGGTYEISLEGYYKEMDDLITYKAGYSNLSSTESWENAIITQGMGNSYGGELFIQKKKGSTSGWIGYTLSWTNRKFENLNFGNWYPYKYDRRHDLSIVFSHKFNEKHDVGFTWVYGTGNAITFPQSVYFGQPYSYDWYEGTFIDLVESYEERNSTRMPAYHRLDLGYNMHKFSKRNKWKSTLSVGAYNIYNRQNPFFIYLDIEEKTGNRVANQVSLFPIIPSISYRIQF